MVAGDLSDYHVCCGLGQCISRLEVWRMEERHGHIGDSAGLPGWLAYV